MHIERLAALREKIIKIYDKDIAKLEVKMESLEKRVDKYEVEMKDKLNQLKIQIANSNDLTNSKLDKLFQKLDTIDSDKDYVRGFVKAVLVVASIFAFFLTISMKFMG